MISTLRRGHISPLKRCLVRASLKQSTRSETFTGVATSVECGICKWAPSRPQRVGHCNWAPDAGTTGGRMRATLNMARAYALWAAMSRLLTHKVPKCECQRHTVLPISPFTVSKRTFENALTSCCICTLVPHAKEPTSKDADGMLNRPKALQSPRNSCGALLAIAALTISGSPY